MLTVQNQSQKVLFDLIENLTFRKNGYAENRQSKQNNKNKLLWVMLTNI